MPRALLEGAAIIPAPNSIKQGTHIFLLYVHYTNSLPSEDVSAIVIDYLLSL